ncbi:hypothetical protein [Bacillus sp. AFS040349]|uniref:hypothetical protein n=1 Tax=Bacillus sp. AFS040349 TaxID=2033502 RepID=UPI0021000DBC|nr:hypothetical protein [Bacillus sp. AFS040349]
MNLKLLSQEPIGIILITHHDGVIQVGKDYMLPLSTREKFKGEYVLVLDEWMSDPPSMNMENMDSESMDGIHHSKMEMESEENSSDSEEMGHDMRY